MTQMLVVSPHLDDAVLSLGATMTHVARSGASVAVLTVFAGNPESTRPASGWDRQAGFETEGEAATARRSEDLEACRIVGAAPTWLPFAPGSYGDRRDPDEVWSALAPSVTRADTVYVPGFPLTNEDTPGSPRSSQAGTFPSTSFAIRSSRTGTPFAPKGVSPTVIGSVPESRSPTIAGSVGRSRRTARSCRSSALRAT